MTAPEPTPRPAPRGSPPRAGGVLDPAWEDELRRGQEAEGEAGSIEPELAIVRLFRHARAPELLAPAELEALWASELAPAIAPPPWWRRKWLWGALPALAAAAAVVLVLRGPDDALAPAPQLAARAESPASPAAASAPAGPTASPAQVLAQQFARLEADARRDLDARVDDDRGVLRHDLLAMSLGDKP